MNDKEITLKELYKTLEQKERIAELLKSRLKSLNAEIAAIRQTTWVLIGKRKWDEFYEKEKALELTKEKDMAEDDY